MRCAFRMRRDPLPCVAQPHHFLKTAKKMRKRLIVVAVLGTLAAHNASATSFDFTGTETAAQTLSTGDTGVLSSTGDLDVTTANTAALTIAGSASLVNAGIIYGAGTQSNSRGVHIAAASGSSITVTLTNTGTIKSDNADAVQAKDTGDNVAIVNSGTILANGGQAVDLNNVTTGTTSLVNTASGVITSTDDDSVRTAVNGTVTNAGTIQATGTGSVEGDGINTQTNSGATIVNTGTISGSHHGITGGSATVTNFTMSITNAAGATIEGADGSGINIDGMDATELVTIVNHGLIQGDGITRDGDGVDVDGLVNLVNTGKIISLGADNDTSEGVTVGGGTIYNTGLIEGTTNSVAGTQTGRGITLAGIDTSGSATNIYGDTTVDNYGTILGTSDSGIALTSTQSSSSFKVLIHNEAGGLIEGDGATQAAVSIGTQNSTVVDAGTITAPNSLIAVQATTGILTMSIVGGTASIVGSIDGGSSGASTLAITPGAGNLFTDDYALSHLATVTIGAGTTTLNGNSSSGYTGATTVASGGTLVVGDATHTSASIASSTATVESGGTLEGTGTVGAVTVDSGATLAANTLGAGLTTGNLTLNSGSQYAVTVDSAGHSGVTTVNGNLTIGSGSTLAVNSGGGTVALNTAYTVLKYTGTESGAFTAIQSNYAYVTPTVSYGNGVVDYTLATSSAFNSQGFMLNGASKNANGVASALTSAFENGGNALTSALLSSNASDAKNALVQVAGDEAPAFGQLAAANLAQSSQVVSQRLSQVGGSGISSGEAPLDQSGWAQVNVTRTHTGGDSDTGAGAYDHRSAALSFGYDKQVSPEWRVGGGIAANDDTVSFEDRSASGRIDGAQFLLYGEYVPTSLPVFVKGGLSGGWWENTVNRSVSAGTLAGTTRATFDTTAESLYTEAGINLHVQQFFVQPYLGASVARYQQQGYTESTTSGSSAFALSYGSTTSTTVTSTLGARLGENDVTVLGKSMNWQVDAGWQHRYGPRNDTVQASFTDASADRFNVTGANLDRDMAILGVDASWQINNQAQLYVKLGAALGSTTHAYGGMGGVRWLW